MSFQTFLLPSPCDVLEVNNRQMPSVPVGSQLQKIILTGSKHKGTVRPPDNLICWKEAAPHPGTTCASAEMKVRFVRHLHYSLERLVSFIPSASKPTKMWLSFHWAEGHGAILPLSWRIWGYPSTELKKGSFPSLVPLYLATYCWKRTKRGWEESFTKTLKYGWKRRISRFLGGKHCFLFLPPWNLPWSLLGWNGSLYHTEGYRSIMLLLIALQAEVFPSARVGT